ncbi:hypothetical protein M501DRAFT_1004295 [Patellaria atrata CBS 101060]|uniref:RING zinc finger-like domain-containing protein n=1 Tax=Patellaria atrata CBS 101060 TaxID=1346257 RepID=A0A9P4VP86_9PEZI|nr:hypothetical protein M501DRAFT_1004295 [Patellaria atrata CBS 101060]
MPPRSSLTSSFSVSDANNEVVCPLRNQDGTSCRKRCLGEKRYRSMQEHIRRAHPEHYIAKLPATEESFALMVNTPPSERPQPPPQPPATSAPPAPSGLFLGPGSMSSETDWAVGYGPSGDINSYYTEEYVGRSSDELRRGSLMPKASAAAALAQLHNHRPEEWDSEQEAYSEAEAQNSRPRAHFAIDNQLGIDDQYPVPNTSRPRELLPSSLTRSPPGRSSTLPPVPRSIKPSRPRKSSVSQNARKPKHERTKSKDHVKRLSHDRKAFSAEPQNAAALWGKRWEDLIDAAASATEEDSRDLTPVPGSPRGLSPNPANRASLPPFAASHFQSYTASPLQNTLTPPPPEASDMQPFPSVESSIESSQSGHNFHMTSQGLADSSPNYSHAVQIYCAACRRLSALKESYACTECICGLCQDCVDVLVSEQTRGRIARCPRCGAIGGKFKPFQLDIR